MAIYWDAEGADLDDDPVSGARIRRLTTRPLSNINIYCEQPYTTPDGNRVAVTRAPSPDPRVPPYELCVADISRLRIASIEPVVGSNFLGTSSWSGLLYYLRPNGELIRVDLDTLEKEIVITHWDLPPTASPESVSPDHRYLFCSQRLPDNTFAVIRVDLAARSHEIIYRSEETLSHLQCDPVHGRQLMVQVNRGQRYVPKTGHWLRDNITVTHILLDVETGAERPLPVGPPYTANSCGHAAWIAGTGRIGLAVNWQGMIYRKDDIAHAKATGNLHDPRHPDGNFVTAGPDDTAPTLFAAPEHIFNHVNVSKCGRYFVCDSYGKGMPGPVDLVVGNIETGKYATIVADCGAAGGGAACTHAHAYFTADNRHVIYNSNRDGGICHVYAACVPDDFLPGLE
jgi:hypothetical protein